MDAASLAHSKCAKSPPLSVRTHAARFRGPFTPRALHSSIHWNGIYRLAETVLQNPCRSAKAVSLAREAVRGVEVEDGARTHPDTLLNVLETLAAELEADGQAEDAAAVRERIASTKSEKPS